MEDNYGGSEDGEETADLPMEVEPLLQQVGRQHRTGWREKVIPTDSRLTLCGGTTCAVPHCYETSREKAKYEDSTTAVPFRWVHVGS